MKFLIDGSPVIADTAEAAKALHIARLAAGVAAEAAAAKERGEKPADPVKLPEPAALTALVRTARLDARGIYQGMVEIDPADLTDLHVPAIGECDLPADAARWVPDASNPFGGSFVFLKAEQRAVAGAGVTLEQAFYLLTDELDKVPPLVAQWRAAFQRTADFAVLGKDPS